MLFPPGSLFLCSRSPLQTSNESLIVSVIDQLTNWFSIVHSPVYGFICKFCLFLCSFIKPFISASMCLFAFLFFYAFIYLLTLFIYSHLTADCLLKWLVDWTLIIYWMTLSCSKLGHFILLFLRYLFRFICYLYIAKNNNKKQNNNNK